jgi:putative addiction module CopG family antidote
MGAVPTATGPPGHTDVQLSSEQNKRLIPLDPKTPPSHASSPVLCEASPGLLTPICIKFISLPDPLKDFVEHQIADGRHSSVSEYVRELIRADGKRKSQERLEKMLLKGSPANPPR